MGTTLRLPVALFDSTALPGSGTPTAKSCTAPPALLAHRRHPPTCEAASIVNNSRWMVLAQASYNRVSPWSCTVKWHAPVRRRLPESSCSTAWGSNDCGVQSILACRKAVPSHKPLRYADVRPCRMKGDLDNVGQLGRLRALIREDRPDVVHLHSRRGEVTFGAPCAARLEGVPVVQIAVSTARSPLGREG